MPTKTRKPMKQPRTRYVRVQYMLMVDAGCKLTDRQLCKHMVDADPDGCVFADIGTALDLDGAVTVVSASAQMTDR